MCCKCRVSVDCKNMEFVARRLVYGEKVEARSNFEKSNLQLFRKPACGHSSESNRIEKDRICVPPGLAG